MIMSENRQTDDRKVGIKNPVDLDPDVCYSIIQAKDARYDGTFFTAVRSTGIYCRPVCRARTPKRENVRFYFCAASAEADGFRPCKRCRPETAPGTPAWSGTSTTVSCALRLVGDGFLDEHSVQDLADRLGMGERHLRRLFLEHLGAAPKALAQSRRAHFAARILSDTDLPISRVAHSAGFGSIRQFNDVFRRVFGEPPRSLRRTRSASAQSRWPNKTGQSITLALAYRPPLRWEDLMTFLGKRAVSGVEEVTERAYRRSISIGRAKGILEVRPGRDGANQVTASVEGIEPAVLDQVVRRIRRMFDLDADPLSIAAHLSRDPRLAPLVRAAPGMRLPLTWDPFEAVVRAVLGQQVSVAGAVTIAGRLAQRYGRPIEGEATITRVFPSASELARADFSSIGIPSQRARTLAAVARATLDGLLLFDGSVAPEALDKDFQSIRGIGPWSADYVALRGLGQPDAFPESDLGIRKALDRLGYPSDRRQRKEAIARLSPWRGYAAIYLWKSLSAGG
jgi:AraC family transcriptional regulator, regulatory protein of adaptative response / DNA-3-methyladenine glycosylase II